MSPSRRLAPRAALSIAVLLACLGLVELGFRLAGRGDPVVYEDLTMGWEPHSPFVAVPDQAYQLALAPHYSGHQVYRDALTGDEILSVAVRTNAAGLRGGEQADDDALVVLALGDSVTFGQGVPEDRALPAQLEEALSGPRPVRVLNAGVPSWNLPHELAWLHSRGWELQPDLVLWMFYVNDVSTAQRSLAVDQDRPVRLGSPDWASGEAGLRRLSFVYNAVCRVVERRRLARELLRPAASFRLQGRSYLDELREDMAHGPTMASQLTALAQDCQQHGVPCAVVVLPVLIAGEHDQGTDILDAVSDAAHDAGLQVVRIDDALDPLPMAQRYVLPGDRHPSVEAHQRMARVLAQRLQLPAPTSP